MKIIRYLLISVLISFYNCKTATIDKDEDKGICGIILIIIS